MQRLLIIPAAGLGSRLSSSLPKLLTPVNGETMLEHLLRMYARFVAHVALIVHPRALEAVQNRLAGRPSSALFVQEHPTGMLDAILLARPAVEELRPHRVWVTWCDQVAIHPLTISRLAEADSADPLIALPTCRGTDPYIHLERDASDRIVRVLHRREGDPMPQEGESDAGLFSLSRSAYLDDLPRFSTDLTTGTSTGERNFLPFIPYESRRGAVVTFPCHDASEAVGVNTPADLALVEGVLRDREREA